MIHEQPSQQLVSTDDQRNGQFDETLTASAYELAMELLALVRLECSSFGRLTQRLAPSSQRCKASQHVQLHVGLGQTRAYT